MNARGLIRNAVSTLVRESGQSGPLASITAARHLEWAAREAWRMFARTAREDSATWEQVGEALGLKPDPEGYTTIAESAFRMLASDLGGGPCFPWTCPSCRGTVLDYGPETGHPADAERGHAEGCARLAEAVHAWKAQWEDEGDG